VSREFIKLPTFTKYQKIQKESSWDSNKCSKQQKIEYANKKHQQLGEFFSPIKYVTNLCYIIIIQIEDENLQHQ
jgi:hypothetical protein